MAKRPCARCREPGTIWPGTDICGRCHRSLRPRTPPTPKLCSGCGELRLGLSRGQCGRCRAKDPDWPHAYAERLAIRLGDPPPWLPSFAVYLASRLSPGRAVWIFRHLAPIIANDGATPTAVLQAAVTPGITVGPLARALEAFFLEAGLALPLDRAEQVARAKRARRVVEIPETFRELVAAFDAAQLRARERALRAGTKPRSDRTLEINLSAVRDLARFLVAERPAVREWRLVALTDVEAYLATKRPSNLARQLHCLRAFFRWARTSRQILTDPTKGLRSSSNFAFRGLVLETARQRELLRRWTPEGDSPLHPHEPVAGLLGLLHGASAAEIRHLRVDDVDLGASTVQLGTRPLPTPLDPATRVALERCLDHRSGRAALNPHVLVNQTTKTVTQPVSVNYLERLLAPADVTPRLLRATRLAHLATVMDPILVAQAFGLRRGAALHYVADAVDGGRLPDV